MNLKNAEFLDIFILMSIKNFMLNSLEHEKSFITSGPDAAVTCTKQQISKIGPQTMSNC